MSDILKDFINRELSNQIKTEYPHLKYPCCMYALVTNGTESALNTYICTLKILDRDRNIDERYPEMPLIKTTTAVKKGDIVVITLLYGDMVPYIIGRADA